MVFQVVNFPGSSLKDVEAEVRKTIATFEERGVTQADIDKFVADYESSTIQGLSSVQGKGSQLAANETFTGNPNYIANDLERYRNVKVEDVQRVYNTYIKGQNCVVVSYVPEGQKALIAAEDNFTPVIGRTPETVLNNYDTLSYNKPVETDSTFDRSVKPTPGPSPFVQVPEYWTETMDNGITAIGTQNNEIPMVSIQITIPAGHRNETVENAGVANLMAQLLKEGTESYSGEELSKALENLGSRITANAGGENVTISITSLTKNLDATLDLAKEVMFKPAFEEEAFARIKKNVLEGIANRVNRASELANIAFNEALYGENTIKAIPASGTEESVTGLTNEDVQRYYDDYFSPAVAKVVVVGNLDKATTWEKLSFLADWKGEKYAWAPLKKESPAKPGTIYFKNKEGAAQSEIRIGYRTNMVYNPTGDYYKAQIMNYQLGGNFNSRININLREDKGYTYGARSYFRASTEPGVFSASAGVKKEATAASVKEFLYEMKNYAENGIEEEELNFTKSSMTLKEAREYETPWQKAGFLRRILDYDLSPNYVKEQSEILKNITPQDIHDLAKKHIKTDDMVIVIVGDKATVWDNLQELGWPVVEL